MMWMLTLVLVQAWSPGAPMPTPGFAFACAAVDGRVYAIGGLTSGPDSAEPRAAVEAYDVAGDSWITGYAPLPVPRWYAGGVELNGRIYVLGGTDGPNDYRRVDRFDPAANRWDTVASLPWQRQAMAACSFQNCIYVIGGFSGGGQGNYHRSVARYIPGQDRWETVDSLNSPRASAAAAVVGDRLYVVGGTYFGPLSSVEFFTGDGWVTEPRTLLRARFGLGALACHGSLYAVAGTGRGGQLNSVEKLDSAAGQWVEADSLTHGRAYLGVGVVGDTATAIGGRGPRNAMADVDRCVLPRSGLASSAPSGLIPVRLPSTICAGRVRFDIGNHERLDVLDAAGKVVCSQTSTLDAVLPAGVYHVRLFQHGVPVPACRVTVIR